MNRGFADLRVEPLHHVARWGAPRRRRDAGCPSRIRTSVHGSKVRCPTTRRRGSGALRGGKWSGRRDSNPRPSPWQGDALPTEPLPLDVAPPIRWCRGPGSNWRHRDFQSRALPTELPRPDGFASLGCPSALGRIPRAFSAMPRTRGERPEPWSVSPRRPRPIRLAWNMTCYELGLGEPESRRIAHFGRDLERAVCQMADTGSGAHPQPPLVTCCVPWPGPSRDLERAAFQVRAPRVD